MCGLYVQRGTFEPLWPPPTLSHGLCGFRWYAPSLAGSVSSTQRHHRGTWKLVRNAGLQVCHKTYWIKIRAFSHDPMRSDVIKAGETQHPCDISRSFWEESSSESNISPFTAAWDEARESSQDLELSLPNFQTSLLLVAKHWRPRVKYLNSWAFALPSGQCR